MEWRFGVLDSGNSGRDDKGGEFIRRRRLHFLIFLRFFELKGIDVMFCEGSEGQGAGIGGRVFSQVTERIRVSLEISVCGRGQWDN